MMERTLLEILPLALAAALSPTGRPGLTPGRLRCL